MRNFKELIADLVKKPPILFPMVGGFHLLWLVWTFITDIGMPFPDLIWLEVLWMAAYTFFWLAVCDMKRWAAVGYITVTLLNACVYLAVYNGKLSRDYMSNMFLMDGLFSVVLLYYYKRLT